MQSSRVVVRLKVDPEHIKTFPDPNGLERKRYFAQVAVDEIHRARIEYGPNPREQNLKGKVAGAIRESLKAEPGWFMYYNKGIVLCARDAEYDNKARELTLVFHKNEESPWESPTGNLDGGHTNAIILAAIDGKDEKKWENPTEKKDRQYVTVEVLTGIENGKLSDLVGARNNNIPGRDLSLAVLGKELDWLIETLDEIGVKDKIAWRQFDKDAEISGEEVLAYLSLLNSEVKDKVRCYTGSGRLVSDMKLRPEHKGKNKVMEGLKKTKPVAVEFLKFVDYIHK